MAVRGLQIVVPEVAFNQRGAAILGVTVTFGATSEVQFWYRFLPVHGGSALGGMRGTSITKVPCADAGVSDFKSLADFLREGGRFVAADSMAELEIAIHEELDLGPASRAPSGERCRYAVRILLKPVRR